MANMGCRVMWALMIIHAVKILTVSGADVTYRVAEESPPGTPIGNIADSIDLASIVSPTNLPLMRYSFLNIDQEIRNLFDLGETTGDLRLSTTRALDREAVCPFDRTCTLKLQVVVQSTLGQFFRKYSIDIEVLDINDHAPLFKENATEVRISESVQIPSSYPLPSALDEDTSDINSLQTYDISPPNNLFELSYSKSNPNLMLRVVGELDHETRDEYSLRIIAKDGGSPPRQGVLDVKVIVEDINDNAPVFTEDTYTRVVNETVKPGSVLVTVTARDEDSGVNGQVRYHLSPQQPASIFSMFSIDQVTGDLILLGDFQKAGTEVYNINVEASDGAAQPFTNKTTVVIRVEDTINDPPELLVSVLSINNYSSVTEYAKTGTAVAHLQVKDADKGSNGIVMCRVSHSRYFDLQPLEVKEYTVIVVSPLDRELISEYNVTVTCEDQGIPPLSTSKTFMVKVTDENDNAPSFGDEKEIFLNLKENNEIGLELVTVHADDNDDPATPNGQILYTLENVIGEEFIIDPDNGTIRAMASFNYEKNKGRNFTVVAHDKGSPRRSAWLPVVVTIQDVNDQVPYFSQSPYSLQVSEYLKPGEHIGDLQAFDFEEGKNGETEISYIQGSLKTTSNPHAGSSGSASASDEATGSSQDGGEVEDNLPFDVRPNGSLYLRRAVDHEDISFYEFQVRVTDKGVPPLSDVATVVVEIIDENDNGPVIIQPNVTEMALTASTGADAPEVLLVFEVEDRDTGPNGRLVYMVTARNDSGRFQIGQTSGEVYRTKELSDKDIGIYKLSVMVRDSGVPPRSDVRALIIRVTGGIHGNDSESSAQKSSDQYVIISVTLVCVTILLSVIIILIIVIMRRMDRRRKIPDMDHGHGGPMHIQNANVFVDPIKMDNMRNDAVDRHSKDSDYKDDDVSGDEKKMNDAEFGFANTSSGSINKHGSDGYGFQNNLNLPSSTSREGDIDLEALQLHQVLLQTYQDSQAAAPLAEDGASESSGDTITSDSGRGGSDEDISHNNMAAVNSMDESRAGHNGSFQSNISTFGQSGSLKSSVKDPVRNSSRKHVTFQDMERFRNSVRAQNEGNPASAANPMTRLNTSQKGTVSPRGHQNPLSEMNIPVGRDSSNIRADGLSYGSFSGQGHQVAKNSPRGMPQMGDYGDGRGRDSPRLQTFPTSSATQQTFQPHLKSNRLPFYEGEDNSLPPRESPRDWRDPAHPPPLSSSSTSDLSSNHPSYLHMNSPRDSLTGNLAGSQQFQSTNSPRGAMDPRLTSGYSGGAAADPARRSYKNIPRDVSNNFKQPNSGSGNTRLPTSRTQSPVPLLPPREGKLNAIDSFKNSALLGNDGKHGRGRNQSRVGDRSESVLVPRDWTNESVATTEDGDDQRSTTTSGSYTIDNEDEYLGLDFPKPQDIVV